MNFESNTLASVIKTIGTTYGDSTALLFDGKSYSYMEMLQQSVCCAENLRRMGIGKNDKVAIIMSNSAEYLYLYFACFLIGAWAVPISTRWEEEELNNVLSDSDATMIIYEDYIGIQDYQQIMQGIRKLLPSCRYYVCKGKAFEHELNFDTLFVNDHDSNDQVSFDDIDPEDIALLAYTSGTTGTPKGVMISHRTLVITSKLTGELWDIGPGEIGFSVAPLYAAQGFLAVLIDLVSGVTMKWNKTFNPNDIIRELSRGGITSFHTQPTMWTLLLSQPAFDLVEFSGLTKVVVSGSLCPVELAQKIEDRLGCKVLNAYGLIEATGVVTLTRLDDPPEIRHGTVGEAIQGVEYRIVDENRMDVSNGEVGELAVRGYLMKGYYKNPEKTAEVIDEAGWLYTGDLAALGEDGKSIKIVGRCKDMIIRGGFNVYPIDIEECLLKNDLIHDVAVVGKPDDLLGESITAFIVPKPGVEIGVGDVKRFCRGKVANYKIPDDVVFISQMPIIMSGKVQKQVLKEWVVDGIPSENRFMFDDVSLSEMGG
jgi:fatty-acyl-CoA synthase